MPDPGPRGSRPDEQLPAAGASAAAPSGATPSLSPAEVRAAKFTAANMVRSLLPLTVLILVMVGITAVRQNPEDPVREVEVDSTVFLASQRADYPLLTPQDLPDGWRPTSVRTDAGTAAPGDPVTLEIGWYTPAEEYAGYVVSDDAAAAPLTDELAGAADEGTAQIGGEAWERRTTERGETALTRTEGDAVLLVYGSAPDEELETLAAAVRPYPAP
jgi:hypothetical protein